MQKKAERRRKRQEVRSAQHIAQQAREATPPDDEDMRHPETPPGEPHQHGYARYAKQEVDTPPRHQHQSSFAANHGKACFVRQIAFFEHSMKVIVIITYLAQMSVLHIQCSAKKAIEVYGIFTLISRHKVRYC